jgi:hypothetical protein
MPQSVARSPVELIGHTTVLRFIMGVGRYLHENLKNRVLIVAVEPKNSPVLSGGELVSQTAEGI